MFSRRATPTEEPGLPILVAQRGNDHYFRAKPQLSPEKLFKQKLEWEKKKQTSSTRREVIFGKLNVHIWEEICGEDLNSLKNHILFPNFPSRRIYTKTTEFTYGKGNYAYGERIFGYILPKFTGLYSFYILGASVEVWISTDAVPFSSKQMYKSIPNKKNLDGTFEVKLIADQKCYLEILHKKGRHDEDFVFKWKAPGSSDFVELSGSDISVQLLDDYLGNGEIDSNTPSLEIPVIHRKILFPVLSKQEKLRSNLSLLPLIPNNVVLDVLPTCEYKPSYIVNRKLINYQGVWETHYNSLYPVDKTNLTRDGWICLGNDALNKQEAVDIVKEYMKSLEQKYSGYILSISVVWVY